MKSLLVIAGTDSSGGAGLSRDVAIAQQFGIQVKPVVSAVTAQSDRGVLALHILPATLVRAQILAAFETCSPVAVKIGMLGNDEMVETVIEALAGKNIPIILDPVLRTSSNKALFSGKELQRLFPLVSLLTPNLDEAGALTGGEKATSRPEIEAQAQALHAQGARAVLIKGGHGAGRYCQDYFFAPPCGGIFSAPKLAKGRRGTGCALATAIGCHLALGFSLTEAVARSVRFIRRWIKNSASP